MGLKELFLNDKQPGPVEAPAFSLTKVMAVVAPLVTLIVATVTDLVKDVSFTNGQVTALIIGLVAFLALTGSADVLARALATSAEKSAAALEKSAEASLGAKSPLIAFKSPLSATLSLPGDDEDIKVIAVRDGEPCQFLCRRADETLEWSPADKVVFKK
jgi:hypothetical protein